MKLGMWNRLAIVGAVLSLLVLPAWLIIDANIDFAKAHEEGYSRCIEAVSKPNDGTLSVSQCREIWPIGGQSSYGWPEWREAVMATAIVYATLYVLICLIAWTAKWILRGRQTGP
jgi:hypothetical protein